MPPTKPSSTPPNNEPASANDPKVAKQTRSVLVRLATPPELEGTLFLGLYEATHAGPQTVGDLLNGEDPFIPLKTSGGVRLLNVDQIVCVRTPFEGEADELMTLGERHAVTLTLIDGTSLKGDIYIALPEGHRRPKDFFNHAPKFFPLFKDDQLFYINRRAITAAIV